MIRVLALALALAAGGRVEARVDGEPVADISRAAIAAANTLAFRVEATRCEARHEQRWWTVYCYPDGPAPVWHRAAELPIAFELHGHAVEIAVSGSER